MTTDVQNAEAAAINTEVRLARLEAYQLAIGQKLDENTQITLASNALMADVKAILDACRLGLRVLGGIGQIAKWVGSITVGITAVVAFYHWFTTK